MRSIVATVAEVCQGLVAATRSRKRCAEARRASSGSTRRRRARSTSANSASPIQRSAASRVAGSAILCSGSAPSSPAEWARRWSLRAYSSAGRFSGTSANGSPAPLPSSSRLMRSQLRKHLAGGLGLGFPEHMGVAADQLLDHALGDLGEASRAALLEQQRQEVDLEQHVAELVDELAVVAAARGVGQLVGLLDRVRDDRALVLLAVPGALAAQPAGDLVEAAERVERFAIHPARRGTGRGAPPCGTAPGGTGAAAGPDARRACDGGRRLDRALRQRRDRLPGEHRRAARARRRGVEITGASARDRSGRGA